MQFYLYKVFGYQTSLLSKEVRNEIYYLKTVPPKKIQKETTTSTCGNFKTDHEPFPKHVMRNRTKQIQDMLPKYKPEPCQTHACRLPQYNQFLKLGGNLSQKNLTKFIHHILYFSSMLLTCSWFSGFFPFVKGKHFM